MTNKTLEVKPNKKSFVNEIIQENKKILALNKFTKIKTLDRAGIISTSRRN